MNNQQLKLSNTIYDDKNNKASDYASVNEIAGGGILEEVLLYIPVDTPFTAFAMPLTKEMAYLLEQVLLKRH